MPRKRKRPKKLNCKPGYKQIGAVCQPLNRLRSPSQLQANDSPDVERKIQQYEDEIKGNPYETMVIADSQTGKKILSTKGGEHYVALPPEYYGPPGIEKLRGQTVTHNHPSASREGTYDLDGRDNLPKGQSFSLADIQVGSYYETGEMRAVGLAYRYSMKPGPNGWSGSDRAKLDKSFKKRYGQELRKTYWQSLFGQVKISRNGYVDKDMYHDIWTNVAKDMGWSYERTAIPSYKSSDVEKQRQLKRKIMTKRNGEWVRKRDSAARPHHPFVLQA